MTGMQAWVHRWALVQGLPRLGSKLGVSIMQEHFDLRHKPPRHRMALVDTPITLFRVQVKANLGQVTRLLETVTKQKLEAEAAKRKRRGATKR